jgi:hypothetical protein
MGTLGQKLVVALVAAVAGSMAGFSGSTAEANPPIVQTIAASQPARMKLAAFHPSANPEPTRPAVEESSVEHDPVVILRGDAAPLVRTAPVTRDALTVGSALDVGSGLSDGPATGRSKRASDSPAPSKKPLERSRKRPSARFGQSEIVDPWSSKR